MWTLRPPCRSSSVLVEPAAGLPPGGRPLALRPRLAAGLPYVLQLSLVYRPGVVAPRGPLDGRSTRMRSSMVAVESGGDRWKPWPRSQPSSRSTSSWPAARCPRRRPRRPSVPPSSMIMRMNARVLRAARSTPVDERLGDLEDVDGQPAQVARARSSRCRSRRARGARRARAARAARSSAIGSSQRATLSVISSTSRLGRRGRTRRAPRRRADELARARAPTTETLTCTAGVDGPAGGGVRGRPREDRAAERARPAGLLGERDELGGPTRPRARVVPAHERLDGDDLAVVERDDRLVLRPRARRARPRCWSSLLEPVAAQHRVVHAAARTPRRGPCRAAWRRTWRRRRRGISSSARVGAGRPVAMPTLDADARPRSPPAATAASASRMRSATAIAVLGRRRRRSSSTRELVAAEARGDVGGRHAGAQAVGDARSAAVADGVAERVVDGLEVVEVDEQHGDAPARAARAPPRRGR